MIHHLIYNHRKIPPMLQMITKQEGNHFQGRSPQAHDLRIRGGTSRQVCPFQLPISCFVSKAFPWIMNSIINGSTKFSSSALPPLHLHICIVFEVISKIDFPVYLPTIAFSAALNTWAQHSRRCTALLQSYMFLCDRWPACVAHTRVRMMGVSLVLHIQSFWPYHCRSYSLIEGCNHHPSPILRETGFRSYLPIALSTARLTKLTAGSKEWSGHWRNRKWMKLLDPMISRTL